MYSFLIHIKLGTLHIRQFNIKLKILQIRSQKLFFEKKYEIQRKQKVAKKKKQKNIKIIKNGIFYKQQTVIEEEDEEKNGKEINGEKEVVKEPKVVKKEPKVIDIEETVPDMVNEQKKLDKLRFVEISI